MAENEQRQQGINDGQRGPRQTQVRPESYENSISYMGQALYVGTLGPGDYCEGCTAVCARVTSTWLSGYRRHYTVVLPTSHQGPDMSTE